MRVLVTGATGFIGRVLVSALLNNSSSPESLPAGEAEAEIVLLVREDGSGSRRLPAPLDQRRQQFSVVYGDLRNFNLTVRAVREAEPTHVVHLAAAGVSDPFLPADTAVRHNVTGTVNLLRACFENCSGIQQLIVARTPGERAAMNSYAASKSAAWSFCAMYGRTAGWPIHGAMIYQAYGPGQEAQRVLPLAIRAALAGQDFPMTSGTQERDWIYIGDVADGLQAMLRHAALPVGTTVELGTGRVTSLLEVVEEIYRLVGHGGVPRPGLLPNRPGEENRQLADLSSTSALLAWRPAVSLRQGLQQTIAWSQGSGQKMDW